MCRSVPRRAVMTLCELKHWPCSKQFCPGFVTQLRSAGLHYQVNTTGTVNLLNFIAYYPVGMYICCWDHDLMFKTVTTRLRGGVYVVIDATEYSGLAPPMILLNMILELQQVCNHACALTWPLCVNACVHYVRACRKRIALRSMLLRRSGASLKYESM